MSAEGRANESSGLATRGRIERGRAKCRSSRAAVLPVDLVALSLCSAVTETRLIRLIKAWDHGGGGLIGSFRRVTA